VSSYDSLILDACCAINLFATNHAGPILRSVGCPIVVARYVAEREMLSLAALPLSGDETLDERLARHATAIIDLQEEEEEHFFALAAQMDDGEAITAAIAISRHWAIATDERKVGLILNRIAPTIRVVTTPELVKHWAEQSAVDGILLHSVLADIEAKARFYPWKAHPLYEWWRSSVR
jgi:hypothetical protein